MWKCEHEALLLHCILLFLWAPQAVVGNMLEEIGKALLPCVHYGVDLWTCNKFGRKYINVHVFHVSSNFELRHALLAVS